ncbi:MAG: hypothetical protein MOB07_06580, partial [Acidobacteria bacterium]|nr:hypothetical protein [Acidobacteriota bacterium]
MELFYITAILTSACLILLFNLVKMFPDVFGDYCEGCRLIALVVGFIMSSLAGYYYYAETELGVAFGFIIHLFVL